jgi:hypothetical protein
VIADMIFRFLSNALEPFAYFIFSLAFFLQGAKDKTNKVRLLFIHYVVCTLLMSYASWKAHYDEDNRWTYTVLWFQSSVLISWYFHQLFKSRRKKLVIKCIIVINSLYFVINNIYYGQLFRFDSLGYSFLSLTISVLAFMYFYDVLTHVSEQPIWNDFNFWLITGYLIYFLVSFAIFLTYHQLTNKILPTYSSAERDLLTELWMVQNGLLFLSAITTLSGYLWTSSRNRLY